jgi:Ser/Thr protein kinase RdoA (MazF antagonist)
VNAHADVAARAVVSEFAIDGELLAVEKFERGHIHDTFISRFRRSDGSERRYLHQRLNDRVFRDVPALMNNIERVTGHLAGQYGDPDVVSHMHALELVPARSGASFVAAGSGPWRTYVYIEGTRSLDLCEGPEQAWQAARAFGQFQADLIDLDVSGLRMTIPNFFSSPYRMRQLDEAVATDAQQRVRGAKAELAFVGARRGMVDVIEAAMRLGRFPRRVVHGDTKLNNVLFCQDSGKAVCVVDLDTCMPGYSLYDFGDLVRFTAACSKEDETDLHRVGTDPELFRALVDGYLESAAGFLTDDELRLMPFAARLVTFTIGLRFLADHLNGDVYFKVGRENHNLDRARVQFAMVASMEQQTGSMEAWVRSRTRRGALVAGGGTAAAAEA